MIKKIRLNLNKINRDNLNDILLFNNENNIDNLNYMYEYYLHIETTNNKKILNILIEQIHDKSINNNFNYKINIIIISKNIYLKYTYLFDLIDEYNINIFCNEIFIKCDHKQSLLIYKKNLEDDISCHFCKTFASAYIQKNILYIRSLTDIILDKIILCNTNLNITELHIDIDKSYSDYERLEKFIMDILILHPSIKHLTLSRNNPIYFSNDFINLLNHNNISSLTLNNIDILYLGNITNIHTLKKLKLIYNKLNSLRGIEKLKLEELYIIDNYKSFDIKNIKNMDTLKSLYLKNRKMNIFSSDTLNLSGLCNIHTSHIDSNTLNNIIENTQKENIEELDINSNFLDIFNNYIFPNLKKLNIMFTMDRNNINCLSFLTKYNKLEYLEINADMHGVNYDCIKSLSNLKRLKIMTSYDLNMLIDNIVDLHKLTELHIIFMPDARVNKTYNKSNIHKLYKLTNLKVLHLEGYYNLDITGIGSLPNLEYLKLINLKLPNLSQLKTLTTLKYLYLDNDLYTEFQSNINTLKHLINLEELLVYKHYTYTHNIILNELNTLLNLNTLIISSGNYRGYTQEYKDNIEILYQ